MNVGIYLTKNRVPRWIDCVREFFPPGKDVVSVPLVPDMTRGRAQEREAFVLSTRWCSKFYYLPWAARWACGAHTCHSRTKRCFKQSFRSRVDKRKMCNTERSLLIISRCYCSSGHLQPVQSWLYSFGLQLSNMSSRIILAAWLGDHLSVLQYHMK